jgi:hypothetical protein
MQNYFSLLPLDHLAGKFELFGSVVSSRDFERFSRIKVDVDMFYPIVAPHDPRGP